MWLDARMSWPLKDIWSRELTVPRCYQSKTLRLRLSNEEVTTYALWHKRTTRSMKLERQLFKQGCCSLLLYYFASLQLGASSRVAVPMLLWWCYFYKKFFTFFFFFFYNYAITKPPFCYLSMSWVTCTPLSKIGRQKAIWNTDKKKE